MTPPRRRLATPLAWLFTALALLCFAPANAMAQTLGTDDLGLGTYSNVNLNLIFPVTVTTTGEKTYYYYYLDLDGVIESIPESVGVTLMIT